MSAALIAARFIHYGSLTFLFGTLLFPSYAFAGADRDAGAEALRPLRPAVVAAAVLALLSGLVWFGAAVAGMAGDPAAAFQVDTLFMTATTTIFGQVWTVRLAVLAGLAVTIAWPLAPLREVASTLATVGLASLAATGHARVGEGEVGWTHGVADAAHLLTAGLWMGALPCLTVLLTRSSLAASILSLDAVRRFSAIATPAVALLILTGAISTVILAGSPWTVGATLWGRLLLLKGAIVVVMCALAASNRWRITPMLARDPARGAARLRRNAILELGLATVVLAIVGVLGTLAPRG